MNLTSNLAFPDCEQSKLDDLNRLFIDWKNEMERVDEQHPDLPNLANGMVFEGFYPHYFSSRKKVLIVGREARDLEGHNYLDVLHKCYREELMIGESHLNQSRFHSMMIYLAHELQRGEMRKWDDVPMASDLTGQFAVEYGFSFAFMNLSKVSNDTTDWGSHWGVIDHFLKTSTQSRNFLAEQINILQPDLIITMNLEHRLDFLGEVGDMQWSTDVTRWEYRSTERPIPLFDTWHFASPSKSPESRIYEPLAAAFRKQGLVE